MRDMRSGAGQREDSVARQMLLLQVMVVATLVVAALALAAYDARRDTRANASDQAVAIALSVADSPTVRRAVGDAEPRLVLQPYAEEVRIDTGVDFVVVMALDRTRYSHPNPAQLGRQFIGDLGGAPAGEVFTQEYVGTLGPSERAVVPVVDDGEVVALVSVGITLDKLQDQLVSDLFPVGGAAAAVLVVGLVGAWLISRRLRRQTHGMGEREITRMYEYYRAVLHAVREGLVLLDPANRVQLVNDEARRLLDLPDDVVGRSIEELGLPPGLVSAATGDTVESDDIYVTGEHVLVVSSSPALWEGREVGAVVTLRDHTELQTVTGELDVVRGLTESLRSQTHEASNRLHTVVSLIEMGRSDEAIEFATEELQVAQLLTDRVVGAVGEPVVAALLLGKTAEAAERGVQLRLTGELPSDQPVAAPRELITVLGNLVDNALDAVTGREERRVSVHLEGTPTWLRITVGDSGPGLAPGEAEHVLDRGWTTKASGSVPGRGVGLALVAQVARRHGGRITIGSSELGGAELVVVLGALPA